MPKTLIKVDFKTPPEKQPQLHNRWHPDLPMVAWVKPGDEFRVECVDWTGGQIHDDDNAIDVKEVALTKVHYLSGPIGVKGAEPGDLLVVDLLDVGVMPESDWGFTGIFARENGGGFLTDHYPDARKACWHFSGLFASSRHIPGVEFAGITHPGLIGCLPSRELLDTWNKREKELFDTNPDRVPPLCALPNPENAHMGMMKPSAAKSAMKEAVRTVPPREHGGNCDIKNLSRGSKIFFPVYVKGGGLSMGDLHFSQGDGEITFCGAIEMAGFVELRVNIIKGGMKKYGIVNPIFQPSPVEPNYNRYLIFEGISVDEKGKAALSGCSCRVSPGVLERDQLSEKIRLHRRTGLRDFGYRTGAGTHQRHCGYPKCLRHVVCAFGNIQIRHPAECERTKENGHWQNGFGQGQIMN